MLNARSYPPNETLAERKVKYNDRRLKNDPCVKEHDQSLKCLDDNFYDRGKCGAFFENYNKCKEFWGNVYQTRKRRGITPYLPDVKDRESVKQQFLKNVT